MKILILQDNIPPQSIGGAGIVAYDLAKEMKRLGHDIYIIATTQSKSDEGSYVQDGLKIYKIYSQYHRRWRAYLSLYNPQTVKKVRKIIAEIRPDVVNAHNVHYYLSYYCLKIAKLAGARVFLTAHDVMLVNYSSIKIPKEANCGNFINYCKTPLFSQIRKYKKRYNPLRNLIIRHYIEKYVDKIFAVSKVLKEILLLNGIGNSEVIHNGIDTDAYKTDETAATVFKKENGLENKKIILFAGRMSEEKGVIQAIGALNLISKKIPEVLLVMAGQSGKWISGISAGLPVKLLGQLTREDMKLALAASDVVIFPSTSFETFGMIVLEAMAARKPVVGSCFGGAREVIVEGKTGYVVNPYDIGVMADKILDLLENTQRATEFGYNGYERAKDNFNLKQQAERYLSFYKQ